MKINSETIHPVQFIFVELKNFLIPLCKKPYFLLRWINYIYLKDDIILQLFTACHTLFTFILFFKSNLYLEEYTRPNDLISFVPSKWF